MQKIEYAKWLEGKMKPNSIKDRISRCSNVEKALGIDLDNEYESDKGENVIKMLMYSPDDVRSNKPIPSGFSFKAGSNPVQRLTDLRSAVKNYFNYKDAVVSAEK